MLKSIGVVLGSYLLSVALVVCTNPLLSRMFPGTHSVDGLVRADMPLIVSTGFFFVISIFCAWICARFAPRNPRKHVLWCFVLGEVVGSVAIFSNWDYGSPHWYGLSWLIAWPIACWIGLMIAGRRGSQAVA